MSAASKGTMIAIFSLAAILTVVFIELLYFCLLARFNRKSFNREVSDEKALKAGKARVVERKVQSVERKRDHLRLVTNSDLKRR